MTAITFVPYVDSELEMPPQGITRTYGQHKITVRDVVADGGGWRYIWRCEIGACVVEGVALGSLDMAFDTAQRELERFMR